MRAHSSVVEQRPFKPRVVGSSPTGPSKMVKNYQIKSETVRMKILEGQSKKQAERYISDATKLAEKATCRRAKCGCVLVKAGQIIGTGFNSPPHDDEEQRTCDNKYTYSQGKKLKYDVTCCVHAEWRSLMEALKKHQDKLKGSTLYFMRIEDGKPKKTQPFCTVCSRLLLEAGVKEIVLWQQEGLISYNAPEYNQISYAFFK